MIVRVVAVGRVRDASLRDACAQYAGRLERYLRFETIEVREAGRRAADAAATRQLEAASLLKAIPDGSRIVALSRAGRQTDSAALARRLEQWRVAARDVAFVIGGAEGLDQALLDRAESALSLSSLTLPHELARLVLLEQLYRACTILAGEPYHRSGGSSGKTG